MSKKRHVKVIGKHKTAGYCWALRHANLKYSRKKVGKKSWIVSYWK